MDIQISAVLAEDVPTIGTLAREIWQVAYLDMIGQGQIDYMLAQRYSAERMREELALPHVWWRKIRLAGETVGFSSCHLDADKAEMKLDKLYVHPRCQRQGLGGRLMADAVDLARARGCRDLVLCVHKHNGPAIAAYRKHGFDIREPVYIDIGGGFVMDDYLMAKAVA